MATSLWRREPLCLVHHVDTLWRSRSRYRWPDPAPPNSSAAMAVLLQLQDRNFSASVAKERLLNSFAFDSLVRKQASVGGGKNRKKTQVDFSRGGSFATFELFCVRPSKARLGMNGIYCKFSNTLPPPNSSWTSEVCLKPQAWLGISLWKYSPYSKLIR